MKTSMTITTCRPRMLYGRLLVASGVGRMSLLVTVLALSGCNTGTITVKPPAEGSQVISPFTVEISWTGDMKEPDSIRFDNKDVKTEFSIDYVNKIAKATLKTSTPGPHKIEASYQKPPIATFIKLYTFSRINGLVTFTVDPCPAGQQYCDGVCKNLQTDDPQNCGACNNACVSGQTCVQGNCQCPTGQHLCRGRCINLCPDKYVYKCGLCIMSTKPFGSSDLDDCTSPTRLPNGIISCPQGYTDSHGVCVRSSGGFNSMLPPACP